MRLRGGGGSDDERASKRAKLGTILDTPPEPHEIFSDDGRRKIRSC